MKQWTKITNDCINQLNSGANDTGNGETLTEHTHLHAHRHIHPQINVQQRIKYIYNRE